MGAALIRKCWDVQEEKWGGHDRQSIDSVFQHDLFYQNQSINNSNIRYGQRKSI